MWNFLHKLFPSATSKQSDHYAEIDRAVVQKYARGNLNLQAGCYKTLATIRKERADFLAYRFK